MKLYVMSKTLLGVVIHLMTSANSNFWLLNFIFSAIGSHFLFVYLQCFTDLAMITTNLVFIAKIFLVIKRYGAGDE